MPTNPGVNDPQSYADLQARARAEVASELKSVNSPLKTQIGSLGRKQGAAAGAIGSEFAGLMPYVAGSAKRVEGSYDNSLAMEQAIFQAAGQRMNNLKQQAASDGQQLAQQMGGPVAIGEFTKGLDPYEAQMGNAQGSTMLHSLGLAQAGVQEAEQYAGQVFPALQTEQTAKSNEFFQDQVKSLKDQINQNNASKSQLTGTRLSQLVSEERAYDLERARFGLQKQTANADLRIRQQELQQRATQLGISVQRLQFEENKAAISESQRQEQLNINIHKNAVSVLDGATGTGKPVTLSVLTYIPKGTVEEAHAIAGKVSGAHYDKKKDQWYYYQHETLTPQQWAKKGYGSSMSDPNDLYSLLRGAVPGLSKQATIQLIRGKTGLSNWSPGQQTKYTGKELHAMPLKELDGIARDRGFKGNFKNRQAVTDFILGH